MGITKKKLDDYVLNALSQMFPKANTIELVKVQSSLYRETMLGVTFKIDGGKNQYTEIYRP